MDTEVMTAFGQFVFVTAFGQNRIRIRIWPIFKVLTAFGQTAFGQFWCFSVLAKFSVVVVVIVPGCCCLLLLLFFLVVVVVLGCCLLVPGGGWWCLLVAVGGWWCLLSVCGGCVQDFWASPGPPSAGPPFPWTAQNFALFFLSPTGKFILSSLSGGLLVEFWWCF